MMRATVTARGPFYGRFHTRVNPKAIAKFGKLERTAEFYTWESFFGLRKLRPQPRSVERFWNKEIFEYEKRTWRPTTVMNMKLYTQMFFYPWFAFYWYQSLKMFLPDQVIDKPHKIDGRYSDDPNRIPWPLLHKQVTDMREGKMGLEDMQKLWDHVKYFYNEDWLIPVELVQILKYTTGMYLSQFVTDSDQLRTEVIDQLLRIHYDKVSSEWRVTPDVKEILSLAVDDLERLGSVATDHIPLVPANTGI